MQYPRVTDTARRHRPRYAERRAGKKNHFFCTYQSSVTTVEVRWASLHFSDVKFSQDFTHQHGLAHPKLTWGSCFWPIKFLFTLGEELTSLSSALWCPNSCYAVKELRPNQKCQSTEGKKYRFDCRFACLVDAVLTTTVIDFSSNKVQNGDIRLPAHRVLVENGCWTSVTS